MQITDVKGLEIKDSRGNPTIEVFVSSGDVTSSFAVPSGASTGKAEAYELRDDETKGMNKVISIIEEKIKPALVGKSLFDQKAIDELMISLDGTEHKTNLGGNTMIGVSVACAKCAAKVKNLALYDHLRTLSTVPLEGQNIPYLYVNLINGGKHSHSELAFQEYHIVPQTSNVKDALEMTEKITVELEKIIKDNGFEIVLGDEGGFAISTKDIILPLKFLKGAIEKAGLAGKVKYALDVASTSFYDESASSYKVSGQNISKEELQNIYKEICKDYDLVSIEDPFYEEAFADFTNYQDELSPTFFVGDDLTTTNVTRIKKAVEEKSIKGLIVKLNQIGTLSETIDAITYAQANDVKCIVSHRSGETLDSFIADLAMAFNCFGIKTGSPRAIERKAKYDRLVEILS